jgi:UDP-glucose 6-dehydrogenase
MANISVVGIWPQGAVLSACLADMGHQVQGIELDASIVERLTQGEPPVYEPELDTPVGDDDRADLSGV